MAKKDKYVVGLDIGSVKTSVLIAEIDDEQVKFLALGAAESKGLRKGLIVNLDSTVSSIRRAVEEAVRLIHSVVDDLQRFPSVELQRRSAAFGSRLLPARLRV